MSVDERFNDFLKKVDDMEKELSEWRDKYIGLETSLNQTIQMVNQLVMNVNASNKFVADLHNALADAGLCSSPKEVMDNIKEDKIPPEAEKLIEENENISSKVEEIMEEVN